MSSYMQPRANLGGIGRQPFRPGQWQGFRGVSQNTTYIQNNFYGSSIFGANRNFGYIQSGCQHCNGDSGMPKWMQWMMGIGMASSLIGGILNLFKKPEAGGNDNGNNGVNNNGNDGNNNVNNNGNGNNGNNVDNNGNNGNHNVDNNGNGENGNGNVNNNNNNNNGNNDYSKLNSTADMICRDASGKTANISGSFAVKEAGENGQPPKSITITDSSSGQAHEYTYELTGTSADGKPIYTCKSMNGQAASSENAYTLEMNGRDGKPELVQYKNQANHGSGLRFGSTAVNRPTPAPVQGFSQTIDIYTSVGPAKVTVKADSQEELEKKIKEYEEQSKKWDPANRQAPQSQQRRGPAQPGSFGGGSTGGGGASGTW